MKRRLWYDYFEGCAIVYHSIWKGIFRGTLLYVVDRILVVRKWLRGPDR